MKKFFTTSKIIKAIISIVLLISISLPFSSCTTLTETLGPNSNDYEKIELIKKSVYDSDLKQNIEKDVYSVTKIRYILRDFNIYEVTDWLLILSFTWPLLLFFVSKKTTNSKFKTYIWSAQLLFSILAGSIIFTQGIVGARIGAIISFFSNFIILILWLLEGILMIYLKNKYTSLPNASDNLNIDFPINTGW